MKLSFLQFFDGSFSHFLPGSILLYAPQTSELYKSMRRKRVSKDLLHIDIGSLLKSRNCCLNRRLTYVSVFIGIVDFVPFQKEEVFLMCRFTVLLLEG